MTIGPEPMRRIFLMERSLGMMRPADYANPVPKGNEMRPANFHRLPTPQQLILETRALDVKFQ